MTTRAIVVLGGPTASGKSHLAIRLAQALDGEIVNADSQQVYRGLDIGTGKPTPDERRQVPHHLFDVVEPWEQLDVARFVALADACVADIHDRGRLPIVVGGTGLWLRCLLFGLVEAPGRNDALRDALEAEARQVGWPALHARLAAVDPVTAARVHPTDPVRIVRALEVYQQGGVPLSTLQARQAGQAPRHVFHALRLDPEPAWLTPRIEARVDAMLSGGLVEETRVLMNEPRAHERLSRVMGYREVLALLDGRLSLAGARELIVRAQRQYAKRQRTWFRAETHWQDVPPDAPCEAAVELLRRTSAPEGSTATRESGA